MFSLVVYLELNFLIPVIRHYPTDIRFLENTYVSPTDVITLIGVISLIVMFYKVLTC